ncbi:MAG: YceI family protein [Crocinitomicaceae bacterium]|nr:YceI family protein [Crocinitomicaceae bacterium]
MKKVFLLFIGLGLFATSCVSNPEGEKVEATDEQNAAELNGAEYQLNVGESSLIWTGRKVSATHHGTVQFKSGKIHVENNAISAGNFVADMTSIVNEDLTGDMNAKIVGHLKSPDFFSVDEFPESSFEITSVKATDNAKQVVISGNLKIKDISKNITFNADLVEFTDSKVQFKADFNIERADWGITYAGMADDLIAKEINYKVNVVAYK